MTLTTLVQAIWLFAGICLVILILLHSPKGDGLAGIGGQAQLFSSAKSAETTLNRVTWMLAILFMGLAVILAAGWLPGAPQGSVAPPAEEALPGVPTPETVPVPPVIPAQPESAPTTTPTVP